MHARPAPPVSLTRCWDKARWHYDAATFPKGLGIAGARAHILACLEFLDARGFLTASGRRQPGEALLDEHVRSPARAFLDESYDAYLARTSYGARPPVPFLTAAWSDYEARFDLSRRSRPTPFQAMLARVPGRSLDDLLWELRSTPPLLEELRAALPSVPPSDLALVTATLALRDGDAAAVARAHADSALVLFALRYFGPSSRKRAAAEAAARSVLRAVAALAVRFDVEADGGAASWSREKLEAFGAALDLAAPRAAIEHAWRALSAPDRRRISHALAAIASAGVADRASASPAARALAQIARSRP